MDKSETPRPGPQPSGAQPKPKIEENNTLGRGADTRKDDENSQHSGGASGAGGVGGTGGSVL
ncbi:MAG TPA: hypothetical protein VIO94_14850 [Phenylobacterium sp.]